MEELLFKYCFACKKIVDLEPPNFDDEFCPLCGSQMILPLEDRRLKVEVVSKLLGRIQTSDNGNGELVQALKQLSGISVSAALDMKFCFKCNKKKPLTHRYCSTKGCGTELEFPKDDRKRLAAMAIILSSVELDGNEHSKTLRAVQTVISLPG